MKNIFLTGGGGAGTIAIARELKKSGKYRVIMGDMDKWAAGLKFGDAAYALPPAADKDFIKRVSEIIEKEKIGIFAPLVDEEILKAYSLKERFPELKILLPEYNFAVNALDKWLLMNKLNEFKIQCPKTSLAVGGKFYYGKPLIVKPRAGRGSRFVFSADSDKKVKAYLDFFGFKGEEILVQEKISGKEFTVSAVVNSKGGIISIVPKEVIQKRGITINAVTRKNKKIEDLCVKIQESMKANGPFNVQLILRDDNAPFVFEINPRFSTTVALTIAAGVNEVDLIAEDFDPKGKLIGFKENLVMCRYNEQFIFEEKMI